MKESDSMSKNMIGAKTTPKAVETTPVPISVPEEEKPFEP